MKQANKFISVFMMLLCVAAAQETRIFRDGGSPTEACRAFGLTAEPTADWSVAVDRIALALCAPTLRKAA